MMWINLNNKNHKLKDRMNNNNNIICKYNKMKDNTIKSMNMIRTWVAQIKVVQCQAAPRLLPHSRIAIKSINSKTLYRGRTQTILLNINQQIIHSWKNNSECSFLIKNNSFLNSISTNLRWSPGLNN